MAIVTLITDFGTRDGYVGEMKGVLLERCPAATVVDVTHEIEPGNIPGASWVLGRVWERFPEGTVHLVVVDPGVGGQRRAVVLKQDGRWFVGPDNGLITRAISGEPSEARAIDPDSLGLAPASVTFHGRDLFAPAAAWLAGGGAPDRVGRAIDPAKLVRLEFPAPERVGVAVRGHVAHVDRFGNLVTNLAEKDFAATSMRFAPDRIARRVATFDDGADDEVVLLPGSSGLLELVVNGGSAAAATGLGRGDVIEVGE